MIIDDQKELRILVRKISFLLQHQYIVPEIKEIILDNIENFSHSSSYEDGAIHALLFLIESLEEKSIKD